jgi:hypothetical protein
MANINIKRVCADSLVEYIVSKIPELAGKVSSEVEDPGKMAPCLAVKVLPDEFSFEPAQADEVYSADPDDGKVVVDVGSFSGLFTIQLFAVGKEERGKYEQKLIDMFMSTEWAPGTIFVNTPNLTVNGYASLYSAELRVRLGSEDWSDEFAFESKRYSFLEVSVDLPVLITLDANNIESLETALEVIPSGLEFSLIAEDGTSEASGFSNGFSNGFGS